MGIMAQLLKPLEKRTRADCPLRRYASPTNSAIENWAVHCRFWEFASSSALRILELNALTCLRLSSHPLQLHSEIFFFRFFLALRHATYRTTS
jgi:hypothetical protein